MRLTLHVEQSGLSHLWMPRERSAATERISLVDCYESPATCSKGACVQTSQCTAPAAVRVAEGRLGRKLKAKPVTAVCNNALRFSRRVCIGGLIVTAWGCEGCKLCFAQPRRQTWSRAYIQTCVRTHDSVGRNGARLQFHLSGDLHLGSIRGEYVVLDVSTPEAIHLLRLLCAYIHCDC